MTTIDKSLFGVKDFGMMTFSEIANFHNTLDCKSLFSSPTKMDITPWLPLLIKHAHLRDPDLHLTMFDYHAMFWPHFDDRGEIRRDDTPVCNKYWQLYSNKDREYDVKVELRLHKGPFDSQFWGKDIAMVYLSIRIDGVLMNDIENTWNQRLLHIRYDPLNENGYIYYVNDAPKKHLDARLHALHYAEFKANMGRITEDLVAEAMHPKRLVRHLELGGEIEDF